MRQSTSLILASVSLAALLPGAALAQAPAPAPVDSTPSDQQDQSRPNQPEDITNASGQATSEGAIIVTGSRIRRNNFNTPQNIDVVTRDDQILAGTLSTAAALQSASVTSGTAQINGSFLGYLSDNGQAASTIGLRGLGSQRTLVLLNGRRLAPAGVGPQLVAADLNVLPTALVQRIEILREGASSIYGSDAIAGVINIITDTSIDGITLDGFSSIPTYAKGSGQTYRASVTVGKKFAGGHITGSFEYRQDNGLRYGDRPDTRCPRELAFNSSNQEVGQTVPFSTQLRCFPYERGGQGVAAGYGVGFSFNGAPGSRLALANYTQNPTLFGPPVNVAPGGSFNLRPESRQLILQTTIQSPIRTYTGYLNGSFEPGLPGDAELYGEALFTRRESKQWGTDRPDFQRVNNRFTSAQLYGGNYAGTPLEVYGYPVSPFFPVAWANAGYNYFGPFIMPNRLFEQKQRVDFWRANGGIRGNIGLGDWRYDANVQVSRTKSRYDLQTPLTENLGNTVVAVLAPSGTPSQYSVTALPGQVGAGKTYTCKSNVTNGAYNGGLCVPLNFYDPNVLSRGNLPDAAYSYLYPMLNYTKTKFHQETFSLGLDGTLFNLPAGEVKAAMGFEHRHDHVEDTPGTERAAGLTYYFGEAGNTIGSDTVNEAYAEVNIPILKDKPFFHTLELDGSGRYTHYKSYGSGWTYHISGQWAPVEPLRLRGNYGTNFRAPNLYEQYIADSIGFYPAALDPCSNFANNYASTETTYKNCLAALTPLLGATGALGYNPPGGSIEVTTSGGAGTLKAEKARTYGFGGVFTMPKSIVDFSLAIDYWHVKVTGEVGVLGNLILNFCYQAEDYPNNPYCAFIGPRNTAADVPQPDQIGTISSFQNPYVNISQQIASGIDFDARLAVPVFGGSFQAQLQATRNLSQKLEVFPGQGLTEYNGTLGYPGQNGGPKWVASADLRFKKGDVTFHWGIQYVGKSDSTSYDPGLTINPCQGTGPACPTPVHYDLTAETYWEHGASIQYQWPKVGQITLGVNNIFNEKPPTISDVPAVGYPTFGNYFLGGPYDYRGRSVFINLTTSF